MTSLFALVLYRYGNYNYSHDMPSALKFHLSIYFSLFSDLILQVTNLVGQLLGNQPK